MGPKRKGGDGGTEESTLGTVEGKDKDAAHWGEFAKTRCREKVQQIVNCAGRAKVRGGFPNVVKERLVQFRWGAGGGEGIPWGVPHGGNQHFPGPEASREIYVSRGRGKKKEKKKRVLQGGFLRAARIGPGRMSVGNPRRSRIRVTERKGGSNGVKRREKRKVAGLTKKTSGGGQVAASFGTGFPGRRRK